VAARLLWLTRDREPDLRLGMLANGSRPDVTERLIGRIARDPPEVAAQVAAGWLETPEPDRERPALLILNQRVLPNGQTMGVWAPVRQRGLHGRRPARLHRLV
jgi:hypothetical protein